MKEQINEERSTESEAKGVNLADLSDGQLQQGINAGITAMTTEYVQKLRVLESMVKRGVNVNFNAKLADGRKIHIRVR